MPVMCLMLVCVWCDVVHETCVSRCITSWAKNFFLPFLLFPHCCYSRSSLWSHLIFFPSLSFFAFDLLATCCWLTQVMQAGCLIPPTKPKGRPKKNSIPSLGIMDSLLFPSWQHVLFSLHPNTHFSILWLLYSPPHASLFFHRKTSRLSNTRHNTVKRERKKNVAFAGLESLSRLTGLFHRMFQRKRAVCVDACVTLRTPEGCKGRREWMKRPKSEEKEQLFAKGNCRQENRCDIRQQTEGK